MSLQSTSSNSKNPALLCDKLIVLTSICQNIIMTNTELWLWCRNAFGILSLL